MHRPSSVGPILLAIAALLAVPLTAPAEAEAQERFHVLIPDLEPRDGASDRFGDRVARHLRDMMDDHRQYEALDRRELRSLLGDYDLDMEDMWDDCITPIQLANQINAQIVFCGWYEEVGDEHVFTARFEAVGADATFELGPTGFPQRDEEGAARHIFNEFQTFAQQQQYAEWCGQEFRAQNWDEALRRCDQALDANPESRSSLYARARTYMELERYDESLADFETLLELDPNHEAALENAGWVASAMDDRERAREYYGRYLELDPDNASVRMRMAYDLATELEDPRGAVDLISEGTERDPDNLDMWEQLGGFAFTAATEMRRDFEATDGDDAALPAEVQDLYELAIESFNRVLEERGEEVESRNVRNTVAAYLELDQPDRAVEQAEFGLETHENDPRLWDVYATALNRSDRLDDALDALARVEELDPERAEVTNVSIRQGRWLLDAGRADEAIPYLQEAVELGEQPEEQVVNMLFAEGYTQGIDQNDFDYAIEMFEVAKEFDAPSQLRAQVDFFHGWAVYQQAVRLQQPQTLDTAQQTLPLFREARELFQAGQEYADAADGVDLGQMLEAADAYIDIQETIIERETRRNR